jgi:hypothetical protein
MSGSNDERRLLVEAFGGGPWHVEERTNAHVDICDEAGRAVVSCSWSPLAGRRAEALLNLMIRAASAEALLNLASRAPDVGGGNG